MLKNYNNDGTEEVILVNPTSVLPFDTCLWLGITR